jgi:hypothetical protein
MKKLLLILFISFAFISSAYANSIKGAFGFKLGYPGSKESSSIASSIQFNPEKPLLPFKDYSVATTLKQNLVYRITARHSEPSNEKNECFTQYSYDVWIKDCPECFLDETPLNVIKTILVAKYGGLEYDHYRNAKDTNQSISLSFRDGQRSIVLRCSWVYKRPAFYKPFEGDYSLSLTYTDWALEDLFQKEYAEREKQKTLNASSDYDI